MTRSFAILPAAGRSVRMGRPKLLLPWRDRPLIETVLDAWQASRVDRVVLVVHPEDSALAEAGRRAGVEVVVPTLPPIDMKASIALGLSRIAERWAPVSADVWLVAPADMPLLTAAAIDTVLAAHDPQAPRPILPRHAGRNGHPVLFPWSIAQQVSELAENEGLNALVARQEPRRIDLDDAGILADLDTPEAYRRLTGHDLP